MKASSDGLSTSTTRLAKSITICELRFKVRFVMSSTGTRRGASLIGWMLIVMVASDVLTPSLARRVRIACPFESSSTVWKPIVFPSREAIIASSLELLMSWMERSSTGVGFPKSSVSNKYGRSARIPLPPSSTDCEGNPFHRGCPFSVTLNNIVPYGSSPVSE